MSALIRALRAAAPACPLITDPAEQAGYLTDWRGLFHGQAMAVARPGTVEEVAAIVRAAAAHGACIVPQGGNTGLAGAAIPSPERGGANGGGAGDRSSDAASGRPGGGARGVGPGPGRGSGGHGGSDGSDGSSSVQQALGGASSGRPAVLLSLTRMCAVRRLDRVGMTLEVEAGCILQHAKDAALASGRLLPIAFAAQGSATVGGMIATNAGGTNALRYGTVRQMVLGLEAVLADGSIVRRLGGLRKDNAGYDWKQSLVGSEGTLGIVTAAVLRLAPVPRERQVAFVALGAPAAALALLERMQDALGDTLSAFELMSGAGIARVLKHVGGRLPVAAAPWYLLIEVADHAPALAERVQDTLMAGAEAGEIEDAALAETLAQAEQFWSLREHLSEAERHAGRSLKHDVAVAVSAIPAFVAEASAALRALDERLELNVFGHVGDGNLHFNVLPGAADVEDDAVHRTVHDVVARHHGSIAAEHGIGQYRVEELARLCPPQELALMGRLKQAFDPAGILNPGKVLAP